MGRTELSPQRRSQIKKTNIGRIIVFCEGKTEKYYFDYFAEILKKNKYTDVEVVLETASGNAQAVLNYAGRFMQEEANNRKYSHYAKYLAFDCDAPPDIQAVVSAADGYTLLVSNPLFEIWLLMHFEDVEQPLTKREIYQRLADHLNKKYSKGSKGQIRQIVLTGDIEKAIDFARKLEETYAGQGKNIYLDVQDMDPYTSVYTLIEQFMAEIS